MLRIEVYTDGSGDDQAGRWSAKHTRNGEPMAHGGEGFDDETAAEDSFETFAGYIRRGEYEVVHVSRADR